MSSVEGSGPVRGRMLPVEERRMQMNLSGSCPLRGGFDETRGADDIGERLH